MDRITVDVPEAVFTEVPEALTIREREDIFDAIDEGYDIDDIALARMRDEARTPEGLMQALAGVTRFAVYKGGWTQVIGREARGAGYLSERAGYVKDAEGLRHRHDLAVERCTLLMIKALVDKANDGADWAALFKDVSRRILAGVRERLERPQKKAA